MKERFILGLFFPFFDAKLNFGEEKSVSYTYSKLCVPKKKKGTAIFHRVESGMYSVNYKAVKIIHIFFQKKKKKQKNKKNKKQRLFRAFFFILSHNHLYFVRLHV